MAPSPASRSQPGSASLLAALLGGLAIELALLWLWQRNGYWDFSDGVYAQTSRELLHGADLYRGVAAAQPPPIYLVGAGLLAIHDGLASLRVGMALAELASALLVGYALLRLGARRPIALLAALATPLLPIELHEHAQLVPETVAAPLLLLGALLVSRPRGSAQGGAAVALAAAFKVAFVFPALAIVLVAADRRRAAGAFVASGVALGLASLLGYGTALWSEAVRAQFEVGSASLHYVGGLLAQAVWSELPLAILAAPVAWAALRRRALSSDPSLERSLLAAALAGLALGLTLFKRGSYLNVFIVAEPPLLVLAALGAESIWRRGAPLRVLAALLALLLAAQSASILIDPANPPVARRPGARSGLAEASSPAAVNAAVAAARRCPLGEAYSGAPYIAFLADRPMPGAQPDTFMLSYASADRAFARKAAADEPRCPPVR